MAKQRRPQKPKEKVLPGLRKHLVPVDSIAPDPSNARIHPERNLDAIRGSLLAFGQQKPVVVDGRGAIVAGNGLYQAARQLGWPKIAAVRTTLRSVDRMAYALADNRTAELAEWDDEALLRQLQQLRDQTDLAALGFDEEELARLLNPGVRDGLTDPDAVPELPDEATTQPGDLWILGDHRLLCGDAGSTEDVDRLLDGADIHLVASDPPYNVRVEPRSSTAIAAGQSSYTDLSRKMHHQEFDVARGVTDLKKARKKMRPKDRPLENDFLSGEDFDKLLLAWFGQVARVLEAGRSFYIWGGYLMEMDPLYADVIVERWQRFTGKKAKRTKRPKSMPA